MRGMPRLRAAVWILAVVAFSLSACTAAMNPSPQGSADPSVIAGEPTPTALAAPGADVVSSSATDDIEQSSIAPSPDDTIDTPPPGRTATPRPTSKPTSRPTPVATWGDGGYAIGARSPVPLKGTARITVSIGAGPSCDISVRYPSGSSGPNFAAHAFAAAGDWNWKWTVPSSAGTGTATFTTTCTLGGVDKVGHGTFALVAALPSPTPKPTPSPTWSITGSINDTSITPGATVTFSGSVVGNPPPGIAPIDLRCELTVTYHTGEQVKRSEGSVQTRNFTLSLPTSPAAPAGTGSWNVTCYPTAPGSRSVVGSLTFS
jgi:hypothetical protein